MKHDKHLTQEQRYQIHALLKSNTSQNEISRILGVSKSTIGRELKRNIGKRGYRPKQAQKFTTERKANNSQCITDFGWAYVEALLTCKYSPEQITGRLRYLGWKDVPSHERIYQYIYRDKKNGGSLYKHLRCQKTYGKRGYANQDRRGQIVNRVDIEHRPVVADKCQRIGDFKGDTVIGKGHKGVLVTLVDRATPETKIKALRFKLESAFYKNRNDMMTKKKFVFEAALKAVQCGSIRTIHHRCRRCTRSFGETTHRSGFGG